MPKRLGNCWSTGSPDELSPGGSCAYFWFNESSQHRMCLSEWRACNPPGGSRWLSANEDGWCGPWRMKSLPGAEGNRRTPEDCRNPPRCSCVSGEDSLTASIPDYLLKSVWLGTSLVVKWLSLWATNAGVRALVRELDCTCCKWRSCMAQ